MIIDDSYNENPLSVKAAIDVLAQCSGTRLLVFGDMLELGEASSRLHEEIGRAAKLLGIDYLFCFGSESRHTAEAFGNGATHFETQQALVNAVRPLLNEQATVLVKGSNSMGMNQVTSLLLQES